MDKGSSVPVSRCQRRGPAAFISTGPTEPPPLSEPENRGGERREGQAAPGRIGSSVPSCPGGGGEAADAVPASPRPARRVLSVFRWFRSHRYPKSTPTTHGVGAPTAAPIPHRGDPAPLCPLRSALPGGWGVGRGAAGPPHTPRLRVEGGPSRDVRTHRPGVPPRCRCCLPTAPAWPYRRRRVGGRRGGPRSSRQPPPPGRGDGSR